MRVSFLLLFCLLLLLPPQATEANFVTYRYVKWQMTRRIGTQGQICDGGLAQVDSLQFAEFYTIYEGSTVSWPPGTTATNPGGNNPGPEGPDKAIDVSAATKMLDFNFWANGGSFPDSTYGSTVLIVDTGSGNSVTFDSYGWDTANDCRERDPVDWTVSGSNDGSTWTVLDTRTAQTITAERQVNAGLWILNVYSPRIWRLSGHVRLHGGVRLR